MNVPKGHVAALSCRVSRRHFLVQSGWTAGGVTALSGCGFVPALPSFGAPDPNDGLAWVQLRGDGRVRFLCPRAEMGQGAATGLSQIVAEELGLPLDRVDCVYPTTAQIAATQMTVGSQSIENFALPTARAAAALREGLRARAAARAGVSPDRLSLGPRGGFHAPDGALFPLSELVDGGEDTLLEPDPALADAPLLSMAPETRVVGKWQPLQHIDAIVTGRERYARDVWREDMLHGGVARPPHLGAVLEGYDRSAPLAVVGVVAVIEGPDDAVGVIAKTPASLAAGLAALVCRWRDIDEATLARIQTENDIDVAIDAGQLDHTPVDDGSLTAGVEAAVRSLDVRYDTPMVAHAAMEPRAALAEVTDAGVEVYTASQDPWYVQADVARTLGVDRDRVLVHNHRLGGAFGGRIKCQAAVEAAWLARGAGRPVKVQWSREEEFRFNYVGPQFSHRIQAGVTAEGDIAYWHHRMVSSPILLSSALFPPYLHWAADLPADPGTERGTTPPYRMANRRVQFGDVRRAMPTGAWRGLGAAPNTFAVECAMDELAVLAEADPLEFRARHASDPRLASVIRRLAEIVPWKARPGLGMAATAYKGVTFVAVAAEVSRRNGKPIVEHLWCTHDCGRMISPDQVHAQVQGNLVWGIGMVLSERFELSAGIGATANFDRYHIPRNSDVPGMTIELARSELPSSGAAEAAFAPAAAAIINALASLEGSRTRRLPVTA